MEKLSLLNRVKEIYDNNQNIIQYLKSINENKSNSTEDILISYDFQAGSYINEYYKDPVKKDWYCTKLANIINGLGEFNSILEVGVGEGVTFANCLLRMGHIPENIYGFDISWSRIKYAKKFFNDVKIADAQLFTGDLFCTPFKDHSVDLVYTSHSIEPNGGREKEALIELYRITGKYLLLLEPSYLFGSEEAKKRTIEHGYVTNLYNTAKELGYHVIVHSLFQNDITPLNPTELIIIQKDCPKLDTASLACPVSKTDIYRKNNVFYSEQSLLAYPIVDGIPCLLPGNAIVATHFLDVL